MSITLHIVVPDVVFGFMGFVFVGFWAWGLRVWDLRDWGLGFWVQDDLAKSMSSYLMQVGAQVQKLVPPLPPKQLTVPWLLQSIGTFQGIPTLTLTLNN